MYTRGESALFINAYHIFARRNEGYILTANKKDALNELSHLSHLFLPRILMKMFPQPQFGNIQNCFSCWGEYSNSPFSVYEFMYVNDCMF